MLRVGLTGGIASGKSTVASILRDLDCPILEADPLGHELLEQGQAAYDEIVVEFGKAVLDPYGKVDRSKLGAVVFANAEKRARLNQILHPRILDVIRKWFGALDRPGAPEIAVVEAALIIETGYNQELDRVVVCWCRPEQQLKRLQERGLPLEEAKLRIAAQMAVDEKCRLGDDVIDCSGTIAETTRQVNNVYEKLRAAGA